MALSKHECEKILILLSTVTLDDLDRRWRERTGVFLAPTLLSYLPETVQDYALAVYRFVLPHVEDNLPVEGEYTTKWLAPYSALQADLSSKESDFISQLKDIVEHHSPSIDPYEERYYIQIENMLRGDSIDLSKEEFLIAYYSPLRRLSDDPRIAVIVGEIDTLRTLYNNRLERFIAKECKRLVKKVGEHLAYQKIRQEDIEVLDSFKENIPKEDYVSIKDALERRILSANVQKMMKKYIKLAKKPQKVAATPSTTDVNPAFIDVYTDPFIGDFLARLEQEFVKIKPAPISMEIDAPLNDVYAFIFCQQAAKKKGISYDDYLKERADREAFYCDFNKLRPTVLTCLQIAVNSIEPSTVLSADVLSRGAVQAIFTFAKQVRYKLKSHTPTHDYAALAVELYQQLQEHTNFFTLEALLLDPPTLSKENLLANFSMVLIPTTLAIDSLDLTPSIVPLIYDINADGILTELEEIDLSDIEKQALTPVPDSTLKRVSELATGCSGAIPYLLNGEFVIIIDKTAFKVKPFIREDGYTEYKFKAFNWTTLQNNIFVLQSILETSAQWRWIMSQEDATATYEWNPLPKKMADRIKAFKDAKHHLDMLISTANRIFEDAREVLSEIAKIRKTQYYTTFALSGHRLCSWTYNPEEYRIKIASKPIDITGASVRYEINHKNNNRSDNTPENLEIILKKANLDLRSTSIKVRYKDVFYPTLKEYCESTNAGNYKNLQQKVRKLQQEQSIRYKNRLYTKETAENLIVVTD